MTEETQWPHQVTCELSGCSRVIHPKNDQFSVVEIVGNVIQSKGSNNSPTINMKFVACASCTKKLASSKFKRRNRDLNLG